MSPSEPPPPPPVVSAPPPPPVVSAPPPPPVLTDEPEGESVWGLALKLLGVGIATSLVIGTLVLAIFAVAIDSTPQPGGGTARPPGAPTGQP